MRNALSGLRLILPIVMALAFASAACRAGGGAIGRGAVAEGREGQAGGWFLVVDHDGIFEGAIAKTFLQPGEDPTQSDLLEMHRRSQERAVLGISFIRDMKRDGLKYENGNVLDPRDGKIYKAKMTRQRRRPDADDARLSRDLAVRQG